METMREKLEKQLTEIYAMIQNETVNQYELELRHSKEKFAMDEKEKTPYSINGYMVLKYEGYDFNGEEIVKSPIYYGDLTIAEAKVLNRVIFKILTNTIGEYKEIIKQNKGEK